MPWCKEDYERSVTSTAWAVTPYSAGWEDSIKYGEDLPASRELKAIFEEECALPDVPAWAKEIIARQISPLPICGHYAFPQPLLDVCRAIGERHAPQFIISCYTADGNRKRLMAQYVFCLDAWAKRAPLDLVQAEFALRNDAGRDWHAVAGNIYAVLGIPTERKDLLVARLIHRLRWWIKTLIWSDDSRDTFLTDVYMGDARGDEARFSAYGNSPFGDPYFTELEQPEVRALTDRIRQVYPDENKLLDRVESTWLCAPKAFRYLEKLLVDIGGPEAAQAAAEFSLLCDDVNPDRESYGRWYGAFMTSLDAWLAGDESARPELGAYDPVKHWLASILRHKLRLYEVHNSFGILTGVRRGGKQGVQTPA